MGRNSLEQMKMMNSKYMRGVTLMELMIVVVIVIFFAAMLRLSTVK